MIQLPPRKILNISHLFCFCLFGVILNLSSVSIIDIGRRTMLNKKSKGQIKPQKAKNELNKIQNNKANCKLNNLRAKKKSRNRHELRPL